MSLLRTPLVHFFRSGTVLAGAARTVVDTARARSNARDIVYPRLPIPLVEEAAECRRMRQTRDHFARLMADKAYLEAATSLTDIEQARAALPSGARLYMSALDGCMLSLEKEHERLSSQKPDARDHFAIESQLHDIMQARSAAPDHPMLATLAAEAQRIVGWSYRGTGFADEIVPHDLQQFMDRSNAAEALLASVGTAAHASPIHAFVSHAVVKGLDEGDLLVRPRFARLLELDPENIDFYVAQADMLRPDWFGGWDELDSFARISVTETRAMWGASVYARIYAHIEREAAEVRQRGIDWDLFREGIFDDVASGSVLRANRWAAYAFAHKHSQLLRSLMERHMTALSPALWGARQDAFRAAVKVFGRAPEIRAA